MIEENKYERKIIHGHPISTLHLDIERSRDGKVIDVIC